VPRNSSFYSTLSIASQRSWLLTGIASYYNYHLYKKKIKNHSGFLVFRCLSAFILFRHSPIYGRRPWESKCVANHSGHVPPAITLYISSSAADSLSSWKAAISRPPVSYHPRSGSGRKVYHSKRRILVYELSHYESNLFCPPIIRFAISWP